MRRSTFLFAMPRWFEGLARIVDLGSTFDQYNVASSPGEADARALAQDWAAVGDDLRVAMRRFGA
jgi:hypothetical protein